VQQGCLWLSKGPIIALMQGCNDIMAITGHFESHKHPNSWQKAYPLAQGL